MAPADRPVPGRGWRRSALAGVWAAAAFVASGLVSLFSGGGVRLQALRSALFDPATLHSVRITLGATAAALLLGWVLAWPVARWFRSRNAALIQMVVVTPGMAYALAVIAGLRLLGAEEVYSLRSVVLAWSLAGAFSIAAGLVGLLRDLDSRQKEALRVLGASKMRSFFLHEFRGTWPGQRELLLQQAWLCFTSFSLVLLLNGGPPNETLEVALYSALQLGAGSPERACALALWQGLILFGLRCASRGPGALGEAGAPERGLARAPRGIFSRGWVLLLFGGCIVLAKIGGVMAPWGISVGLAVGVAFFCMVLSMGCWVSGYRSWAAAASWTSPLILSWLVWLSWGRTIEPFFLVVFLQGLLFAPGFSRIVFPLLDRMLRSEWEMARVMGAAPALAWWKVEWPRVRGGVLRALGLVFSFSLLEVTTVLLFARGDFETLSIHAQNLFLRFRLEEAMLGTGLLMLTAFAAQLGVEEAG